MNIVFGSWCAKLVTVVDKYKGLILGLQVNMNDHIRLMVTGEVAEFKSDGGEVTTLTARLTMPRHRTERIALEAEFAHPGG